MRPSFPIRPSKIRSRRGLILNMNPMRTVEIIYNILGLVREKARRHPLADCTSAPLNRSE